VTNTPALKHREVDFLQKSRYNEASFLKRHKFADGKVDRYKLDGGVDA